MTELFPCECHYVLINIYIFFMLFSLYKGMLPISLKGHSVNLKQVDVCDMLLCEQKKCRIFTNVELI